MRPVSPYGAPQLAGELMCFTYSHLFQLPVVCLRIFTVYGPRQRPDLAIHKFTALIEAGRPVPIFGDGSMARDYTYIDDITAGVMAALTYEVAPRDGARFEVFNLGNAHPVKLSELVETLEQILGRQAIRDHQPVPSGDVPITWADLTKSCAMLGYQPKTALELGLRQFVAWYGNADPTRKLVFPRG